MKQKSKNKNTGVVREATASEFKMAKKFEDVFPKEHATWKATRGRPKLDSPRVNKTLRLDARLVAVMLASGPYSRRAEQALWREFCE